MKNIVILLAIMLSSTCAIGSPKSDPLSMKVVSSFDELLFEDGSIELNLDIGLKKVTKAVTKVTRKGNGSLSILNLKLKLVDVHNNGLYYKDRILNISFTDINNDSVKDIVIDGVAINSGEVESDPLNEESVIFIYLYNASLGQYEEVFKRSSFEINLNK